MDSFDFLAMPTLNKTMVLELARCEFLACREKVLLLGNSGTGKTQPSCTISFIGPHSENTSVRAAALNEVGGK